MQDKKVANDKGVNVSAFVLFFFVSFVCLFVCHPSVDGFASLTLPFYREFGVELLVCRLTVSQSHTDPMSP